MSDVKVTDVKANAPSGKGTDGKAVTVYDVKWDVLASFPTDDDPYGYGPRPPQVVGCESQAEARRIATEWLAANPTVVAEATVHGRVTRPSQADGALVRINSVVRRVTVTGTVRYDRTDGPVRVLVVGDCHH